MDVIGTPTLVGHASAVIDGGLGWFVRLFSCSFVSVMRVGGPLTFNAHASAAINL
jgi:hypothetical protein